MDLRVGLIGAGAIAGGQADILQKMPGVRVAAVSGRGADRGRKLADDLGARYFTEVPAMLSAPVDAISVCTPHAFHCEGVLAAAAAGKHVLVEKPMGCTVDECDQMIAACRQAGVTLMVGQTFRFQAETIDIRRLIDEGKLGEPVVAIDVTAYGNIALTPWYFDQQLARGGLMMSSASHRIYRLHYLVGSPIVEVHARLGTFGHEIETEDTAVLSLRFANGALGTIVQSCLDYPRPSELSLQLQGTRGAIRLTTGGTLEYWGAEHAFQTRYEGDNAMQKELTEFVAAIRDRRPPAVTGEDGRAVVAVLEAAYHSAKSGRAVAVAEEK